MRTILPLFLVVAGSLLAADVFPPSAYVTSAEVQAAVKGMDPARAAVNFLLKTVDEGDYTVAVVVVRRIPEPGVEEEALSHERITEVYQIVSGSGIMETGGSQPKTVRVDLKPAVGPSNRGPVVAGKTQPIGPGDTVVILPHIPHRFSHLNETIVYLALRIEAKGKEN